MPNRFFLLFVLMAATPLLADVTIDPAMHFLRAGTEREWNDFPDKPEGDRLVVKFNARANTGEVAVRLVHRDLRYNWKVELNGKPIGRLLADDSPTTAILAIPARTLTDGQNVLQISAMAPAAKPGVHVQSDDVSIGRIELLERPRAEVLGESRLALTIIDADRKATTPARITIVDSNGALAAIGDGTGDHLAIRPGVVYTSTGGASIRLPAGTYTVYAQRGFEWSLAQEKIELQPGAAAIRVITVRREVDTVGYAACDPHMHTATYARHGDATMSERMVTLAGEGVELPVSTEHNLQIDFDKPAIGASVRSHLTPVLGNELTTVKFGHYNVFPIAREAKLIDFRAPTWAKLFASADEIAPGATVILNHGRDVHHGFRPFDPSHHISIAGEVLENWLPPIHAMEVINSGATTNDPLILFRDWLGLLNRGHRIAPIGGSDSHDVSRYIVGQGRTYVRCNDADPGNIDIKKASQAIKEGRVLVSFGLLAELTVNGACRSGDTVKLEPGTSELECKVEVRGPAWSRASMVSLFVNGVNVREERIGDAAGSHAGTKYSATWRIPAPRHDVHLVLLARGPGITGLHWPCARPYQPTDSQWEPYALACTGAVYVDADRSGQFDTAFDYAKRIVTHGNDAKAILKQLAGFDGMVALQAASLLRQRPGLDSPQALMELAKEADETVRQGISAYAAAWLHTREAAKK